MTGTTLHALHAVLELLVAPLLAGLATIWAGWMALAAEAEAGLPRMLAGELPPEAELPSSSRSLHVAHLLLLLLGGLLAAVAVGWWRTWPAPVAAGRLLLSVALVWVVGDGLPRILAALTPDLPELAREPALRTLAPFGPFLRLVARADRRRQPDQAGPRRRASGATQRDMLLGLFSLADTTVSEVMTPRIDIVAVDLAAAREEVIATLRRSEHARILVYDEHPDEVSGVLYAKDMLASFALPGEGTPWQRLVRPATFVPEGKSLDRQLRDFQRGHTHIAVVVDEFGGTAGIVTLEDILEQVVGEIQDEHDIDEVAPIQETPEGGLLVQGNAPLAELEGALQHHFGREDVSTVGGLVLAVFGRVPRMGETLELDGFRLSADQVVRRRVRRVRVERLAASRGEEEPS